MELYDCTGCIRVKCPARKLSPPHLNPACWDDGSNIVTATRDRKRKGRPS